MITVTPAGTQADWRAAATLMSEHVAWMAAAFEVDVTHYQADSAHELSDPEVYYRVPCGAMLLARVEGRSAGLVGVHGLGGAHAVVPRAELKRMFVRPEARGLGLGRTLLDAALDAAAGLGYAEVWLQTQPRVMASAHRLYVEAGFAPAEHLRDLGVDGVATLRLPLRDRGLAGRRSSTVIQSATAPPHCGA